MELKFLYRKIDALPQNLQEQIVDFVEFLIMRHQSEHLQAFFKQKATENASSKAVDIENSEANTIKQQLLQKYGQSLEMAILLYEKEILTTRSAAEMIGLNSFEFEAILAQLHIPMHYDIDDFQQDLENLAMQNA